MNFGWNWKDSKDWIVEAAKEGKAFYADKSQFDSAKERQYAVRGYVNKKIDDMFDSRVLATRRRPRWRKKRNPTLAPCLLYPRSSSPCLHYVV